MEETFTHIRNYWKEEEYKKCELEWKQIQTFISNEYTPYQCGRCNTYWKSVAFVNDHDNICPNCDTHCQPFLCNPINYDSVLKYIDPKYHHYLINDYLNENIETFGHILKNELSIPKEQYIQLFQLDKLPYDFPSLKTDDEGIFTGETDEYDIFNKFKLNNGSYEYELKNPDIVAEKFIIKNKIKQMRIDLRRYLNGIFGNHQSYVYPELIASNSAVYDTLYLTDYLLKHIYRILMAIIINGTDEELIKQETYMISMREIEGKYKVSNVKYNYGFLRLIDIISNFVSDNNLKEKQEELNAEHIEFKKLNTIMSASISYEDIKYTLEDDVLNLKKLKGKINITCWKDDEQIELPSYTKYLQQFFNEYYDDIKKAFPIYNRLENIYRLCALNVILDNFNYELEIHDSIYVDTYPRSILCSGGIVLAPKNFIRTLPKPPTPITNKVIEICGIKRGLADAPISVGSLHHAGIMIKTSTNEYHIVEYGQSGGVLRKINPNISGLTMNEEGHNWTIDSCDKMRSNEYDPERVKTLMDIITYGQSYDLIANNCQDIKRKILDALK
jgi:hypothetical protein